MVLPEVGTEGQERLSAASVLVVGAGGLGSPAALYLAAAGVGTLGIVDDDAVEVSNLHRQILHGSADIGRPKADSAGDALRRLNPHVRVVTFAERLTPARADTLFADFDLVVDGSDNYATRYAVNDACARLGKTWVYGSVERYSGQVSVFGAPGGPCYRCVFPNAPAPGSTQNCEEIGVLGATPGVIGTLQATEALKVLLGVGEPLVGRLLSVDLRRGETHTVAFARRPDCEACAGMAAGERTSDALDPEIDPAQLARRLAAAEDVDVIDIREPWEWRFGHIAQARLLAMGELSEQIDTLDPSRELILYCHHGSRSSVATEWLRARGFRARNLVGGIDRWSREIDPTLPRY